MAIDLITARYDIAKIYIAAFNRVPDASGLDHWTNAYMNGASLATIANGFASTEEYANTYASNLTNSEYVSKIYKNVFAREVDSSGSSFWVDALNKGKITKAGLLNELINAATANGSNDGARLKNQAEFGIYCANRDIPYTSVGTQLESITSDSASVATAKSSIGFIYTNAIDISSSGSHADADGINTTYTVLSGDYAHSISNFGVGDKLVFPTDAALSFSNTNYTDGEVTIKSVYGGKTSSISLTGLSSANDALLTSISSFDSVFNAKPISGGTGSGGTGSGSSTSIINVATTGSNSDSSLVNTTYKVTAGNYTYSITGFGAGDKIEFPPSDAIKVVNTNYMDKNVILEYISGGATTKLKLEGFSYENDSKLNSINDFNTLFGNKTVTGDTSTTTTVVAVAGGSTDVKSANVTVQFGSSLGPASYTINNFSKGDILDLPNLDGSYANFLNLALSDGKIIVGWKDKSTVNDYEITILGLSIQEDIAIKDITDLNTVFGAGTLI